MKFETGLKFNQIINNTQLQKIYSCGNSGGMRKSNKNNTLTLIADYTKGFYKDSVENDIVLYTGMGKTGDQSLTNQNKTLFESDINGVELHFFEVFKRNEYTYKGIVELAYPPFQKIQEDIHGNERKVWVFPLIKLGDYKTAVEILDDFIDVPEKSKIISFSEIEIPQINTSKKSRKKIIKKEGYVRDHIGKALLNQLTGDSGEELVIQMEKNKLIHMGLENYCEKIKRVSLDDETLGYDIISFDKDKSGNIYKIFIEVKTTKENEKCNFFISRNEINIMKELKDKYFIYRLFNIDSNNPGFFIIRGDEFDTRFILEAKNFIAKIKPSN